MTRGNQREHDRMKAQKKAAQHAKPKQSGSSLAKKKEADAEAMRQKQAKAKAAVDANGGGTTSEGKK